MSDVSNPRERPVTIPAPQPRQQRQVNIPGQAKKQKKQKGGVRGGLLLFGLLLIAGAVGGFWYVLMSLDERQQVLVAARDIQRWDLVSAGDFTTTEANVGEASALGVNRLDALVGRWATGSIPAGTIVTEGMFQSPPLSGEEETDKVIIEVGLPGDEVPFGGMETGDKLALFGREAAPSGPDGDPLGEGDYGLIGVLTLDFVLDGRLIYIVTPDEALAIHDIVDRFNGASDRRIWKLGFGITLESLQDIYERWLTGSAGAPASAGGPAEPGSGAEPIQ